ncbi:solute carrier family 22 member 7 [Rhipicephalus sanguineus]|uniref:Uncharacterized protein n=1 Tax=Rhipicephalus sanguineus TaxID=34632 RepID=A0A9D4T100_RHISA|nr:solute carrier family 22 member 7 [Rhipicephalus sanguineus]KAH7962743.1 hypothetical protein HPB52_017770 [Rhipicephalus sanguineus]
MAAAPGKQLTPAQSSPSGSQTPWLCETQLPFGDGAFQLMNVFSAAIVLGNYLLHSEIFLLTAGVMDHWCRRPDSFANLSVDEWKQLAIPVDKNGEYSQCTIREPPDGGTEARVVRCTSWEYDYTQYGNNIVSAWNLVCDRLWLIDFARIVYAAASVIPLAASASFADSIGRRTAIFITIPVVLISAVASAVPNDLQFFMIVRAVVSASTSVLVPPAITLVTDASTIDKFPAYVVAVSLLSFILMPVTVLAAHLARTGWVAVQLILMIPTCLLMLLYYTVIESPIWLLATGHMKEAERVALRAAKMNNVSADVCHELMARQITDLRARGWLTAESSGLCSGRLRTRTVLMCCMSTALCFGFDTFVTKDGIPTGDVAASLSFALSAVACVTTIPFVKHFGLRNAVVGSALGFAVTLTALAGTTYGGGGQTLNDSLVVPMKAAGNVCFTFFIVMSLKSLPVVTRCRGAAAVVASSRFGDTLARLTPRLFGDQSIAMGLAISGALMSLFVIGAELFPFDSDYWMRQHLSHESSSRRPSEGTKRAMRDTLVPLPKEPIQHRQIKTKDRVALSRSTTQPAGEQSAV